MTKAKVKVGLNRSGFGLGSVWGRSLVTLGRRWRYFGNTLGILWGDFGHVPGRSPTCNSCEKSTFIMFSKNVFLTIGLPCALRTHEFACLVPIQKQNLITFRFWPGLSFFFFDSQKALRYARQPYQLSTQSVFFGFL